MGLKDMVKGDRNFLGVDPPVESEVLAVAREVARIARGVLRDRQYRVFLYGSWVSSGARPRSDIDIGIAGPEPVDPSAMQQIREACDILPTLYSVEIVDFARAPAAFRAEATSRTLELEPA
jgi:predicted nucleotidyltransferase